MIQSWREEWDLADNADFPFYWVQLADFKAEKAEPAESDWAELREAQTMTLDALPNTGQAVIIDLGEGKDIHPKNKQDVAKRLARWALAETYEQPGIACRSPRYASLEKEGAKIVLSFTDVDRRLAALRRGRAGRLHDRRSRQDVRAGQGGDPQGRPDRGLERRGGRAGGRPLRLGRQSGLQHVFRRRAAADALPHRRLPGRDGRQGVSRGPASMPAWPAPREPAGRSRLCDRPQPVGFSAQCPAGRGRPAASSDARRVCIVSVLTFALFRIRGIGGLRRSRLRARCRLPWPDARAATVAPRARLGSLPAQPELARGDHGIGRSTCAADRACRS